MEMMTTCFQIDWYPEHEASVYRVPPEGMQTVLTKAPHETALVQRALIEFPDLYVIGMVRDPRDMVVSKHAEDPVRYWAGLNFWRCLAPCLLRLQTQPRFIMLSFEKLLENPDAVQHDLMQHLPFLRKKLPFSLFHTAAEPTDRAIRALGGLRAPSVGRVGQWKSHLPRLLGQIRRHGSITADLVKFGYETDLAWDSCLRDVVPDNRPSHWPDEWGLEQICPSPVPPWLLR